MSKTGPVKGSGVDTPERPAYTEHMLSTCTPLRVYMRDSRSLDILKTKYLLDLGLYMLSIYRSFRGISPET